MISPELPNHPFIAADDPEGTASNIQCVIALLKDYSFRQVEAWEIGDNTSSDHLIGQVKILECLSSAVEYLSHLPAVPTMAQLKAVSQVSDMKAAVGGKA